MLKKLSKLDAADGKLRMKAITFLKMVLQYLVQPGRSKPAATKGVITGVNLE